MHRDPAEQVSFAEEDAYWSEVEERDAHHPECDGLCDQYPGTNRNRCWADDLRHTADTAREEADEAVQTLRQVRGERIA